MSALGAEFKVNVHVEPIDGFHMADYDFECQLYVHTNKAVTFSKGDEMLKAAEVRKTMRPHVGGWNAF